MKLFFRKSKYEKLIIKELRNPLTYGVMITRLPGGHSEPMGTTELVIKITQFINKE